MILPMQCMYGHESKNLDSHDVKIKFSIVAIAYIHYINSLISKIPFKSPKQILDHFSIFISSCNQTTGFLSIDFISE